MKTFKQRIFVFGLISVVFLWGAVMYSSPTDTWAIKAGATKKTDALKKANCEVLAPWLGVVPGEERFVPTFVNQATGEPGAYCDIQTGIVWDASPDIGTFTWVAAHSHCTQRTIGGTGQKGWRLMSFAELGSLVDDNSDLCDTGGPCLPDGHPFSNIQSARYWAATMSKFFVSNAWRVDFSDGVLNINGTGMTYRAWCGRGPTNADVY